jgi:hypothetical protein
MTAIAHTPPSPRWSANRLRAAGCQAPLDGVGLMRLQCRYSCRSARGRKRVGRGLRHHGRRVGQRGLSVFLAALLGLAAALLLGPHAQAALKFRPPQPLSPAGQDAADPKLAVDSQGRVTVVWTLLFTPGAEMQSVRLDTDGSPGPIQILGAGSDPQLAVDPQGRATVVWWIGGPPLPVQWRRISAEGIPGETRSLPVDGHRPRVAVDPQGRATVTWQAFGGSNIDMELIQTLRLGADKTPGAVHTVAEVPSLEGVTGLAVDPQGRSTLVWEHPPQAAQLVPDGTPGPVHTLSQPGATVTHDPQVAVDRHGRATVVWEERTGRYAAVQAVRFGADGNPGPVRRLSKGRNANGAQVAVDSEGRATVVWQRKRRIQAVRLGANGAPGKLNTISRPRSYRPQVAVDPKGRAIVVWERAWRRKSGIQARRLGADGRPQGVQTLARGRHDFFPGAQVVVDPNGRPTMVWKQTSGQTGPSRIHSTRGRDGR